MSPTLDLIALPPELLHNVLSRLRRKALFRIRLVNRHLNSLATPSAFRSIHLVAHGDSSKKFRALANSQLRVHVRNVTVDTWLGPSFEYRMMDNWELPDEFINCLPFLSCFRNVDSLHIRFHEDCSEIAGGGEADEFNDDRLDILVKVFQFLAGNWPKEKERLEKAGVEMSDFQWYDDEELPPTVIGPPIQLSNLTIRNLSDRHEPEFTSSEAFKLVVGSTLSDLRLHITTEGVGQERKPNYYSSTKYVSFDNLHTTWLGPDIAANLHTLSLYCREPWGFKPKMDFRRVGQGRGLPNLKVLALGKYTFSHEWQIDWFASLNLEKLYLDECAVLYQYDGRPCDMDRGEIVIGQDDFGNDISISKEGYYKQMYDRHEHDGPHGTDGTTSTSVRWHMILSRWRETMTNLQVFKMGSGDWEDQKAFRKFGCPDPDTPGKDIFRFGSGLSQERSEQLLYIYHTDEWRDWREWEKEYLDFVAEMEEEGEEWDSDEEMFSRWKMEDGLRGRDEAALDLFVSTVEARARKVSKDDR